MLFHMGKEKSLEYRKKSLVKNTAILAFGTLCTKGIMFFMAPLFTRWLARDDYGTFDLIAEYTSLLIPILTLSMGEAVFRFLVDESDEKEKNRVLTTCFIFHVLGIVLTVLIGIILCFFSRLSNTVVMSTVLFLSMEIVYKYLMMTLRGKKNLNAYTVGNILFVLGIAVFVTIFVYFFKWGLEGIILGYAFGDIVANTYMIFKSKIYKEIRCEYFNMATLKKSADYSLPLIPNSISWWIVNVSDRTIITLFLGPGINAIYAIANKVPSLCQNFFGVFHLSWQQNAIETMSDTDRDKYYSSILNDMTRIVGSICILLIGINYWFFTILYTDDYFPGYFQVPILVTAILFSMIAQFLGSIYVARMETKFNGITITISAIINVVINLALIQYIGLYSASVSTLVSYVVLFIIRYIDLRKKMDIHFEKQSIVLALLLLAFAISSYLANVIVSTVDLVLGILIFIRVNYAYLRQALNKILLKKKRQTK